MYKRGDLIKAKEYLFESGKDIADTFTFNDVVHYMAEWKAKKCNLQNVMKSVCPDCNAINAITDGELIKCFNCQNSYRQTVL